MKLLIVEDDAAIRDTLKMLCNHLGADSYVASSIGEAKDVMDKIIPNMIFLDILLNGENGTELIEYARNKYKVKPFIAIVSALSNGQEIADTNKADYFILKPFDIEIIEKLINKN